MPPIFSLLYFICFAVIAGGAFALMTQTLRNNTLLTSQSLRRHPEAPKPGDRVMYIDLNRERLEKLYDQTP